MSILHETLRQRDMYRERYKATKEIYKCTDNKEKRDVYFGILSEMERVLYLFFDDDDFLKEIKGE